METVSLLLPSPEHTGRLGKVLGGLARPGDVFLLVGTLGAGKTTLAQAIAAGLDVPEDCYVTSPSFSLLHEYPGRLPMYHIDCYRLQDEDDVEGSGLMDYIVADGLCVVEWPERLGSLTPAAYLEVELSAVGDDARNVRIAAHGAGWRERMDNLRARLQAAGVLQAE